MTKHLRFLIVLLMTLVWSTGWAAESVYKTLSFPDDNKASNGKNNYTSTWTAKIGSDSWSIVNFSNNNWDWNNIRCGRKKYNSVATITNSNAFGKPITKVVLNASNISNLAKVKSIKLETSKVANFSSIEETVTLATITAGYLTFEIKNPIENGFYKLTFDCLATANGFVQVDQVDYYIDDSKTSTTLSLGGYANKTFSFTNGKSDDTFTTPTATVTPAAATGAVQYISSDKDIVTVATNGDLSFTNTKFGSATISAQFIATGDYANSNTVTYTVVNKEPQKTATEVTFGDKSQQTITLTEGDVTGVVFPKASEKNNIAGTVSYESSNTDVAVVDAEGNVTIKGVYGEATITATFTPTNAETYAVSTDWYKVANKVNAAFYESFDKCDGKGGNNGTFNGTETNSVVSDNKDWTFTNVNGANKCIKLGSNKNDCSATTPAINLSGKGILTFKIASWVDDESTVTISVDNGLLSYNGKNATSFAISPTDKEWNDINMTISATGAVKIKFSSIAKNRFFLDEVMVKEIATPAVENITLDESATNTIKAMTGVNVTLKRSMVVNEWNTICLPFDVTAKQATAAFGVGVKIAQLDANSTGNTLSFTTVDAMQAAAPYLIKPTIAAPTEGYKFDGVEIKAAAVTPTKVETSGNLYFKGIYNMMDVTTDASSGYYAAFLGANNTIFKAKNDGGKMKGFRAYFAILNSVATSALRVTVNGTTTSIKNINSEVVESNAPVYNLQGQRVDGNNLTPGIYVKAGKKFVVR